MYSTIETHVASQAVCRLSGALEHEIAPQLRATMAACAAFDELTIDLSGVRFMDSAALAVVVRGIQRIHDNRGRVTVVGARPNIRRLILATGFDRVASLDDLDGVVPPMAVAS